MSTTSSGRSATPSPSLTIPTRPSSGSGKRPFRPHDYQRGGIKFLLENPAAALLWDPGLGKTSAALKAFQLLRDAGAVRKALVVAPLRVGELVWTQAPGGELAKWEDFAELKAVFVHGPRKEELLAEDADLYVINPDGLRWLVATGRLRGLLRRGVDYLVLDELSRWKHTKTKLFRSLKPYLGRFRRRVGLTGSPAPNGLIDLFGQMYVLDLGRALGQFVSHFRQQFFVPIPFGWRLQEGAEQRIYRAVAHLAQPLRAADHLDLPPLVEQDVMVTLPDDAQRAYDALEQELIAQVEGEVVTAANAAVATGKCRQVASGGVYLDHRSDIAPSARKSQHLHDAKTEALVELVEELQGAPLLVAYEYHHDLERIERGLRALYGETYEAPAINGETSQKRTAEIVAAWNRGELPVLCGHPAAMGHGLNLQAACSHVAWYTLTWDYELYDQLNRRVYRQGQANRVVVHRLLARRTVDEVVLKAIGAKRRGQEALFDALRELRRDRAAPLYKRPEQGYDQARIVTPPAEETTMTKSSQKTGSKKNAKTTKPTAAQPTAAQPTAAPKKTRAFAQQVDVPAPTPEQAKARAVAVVVKDHNSGTAIELRRDANEVVYIPLVKEGALDVRRLSAVAFDAQYKPIVDYPAGRAARLYVGYAVDIGGTAAALDELQHLVNVTEEERQMATGRVNSSAAKAKTDAKAAKAPTKVAKPATTAQKAPAPKAKGQSAAALFKELILKGGQTDDQIFAQVKKVFNLDDGKRSYVAWYRSWLKNHGQNPPAAKVA